MTADIKHFTCNGEIEWRVKMSMIEGYQCVHSTLEVDVPMDEAMKWFEAFNFSLQDFFEEVHINDKNMDKNMVSAVLTSMSGIGTGSRCVTLEFSIVSYSILSVESSDVVAFWDRFVEKTVDSIRCAVVEHELKCSVR